MKIFVATDLHGSAFWTEQVVKKFQCSGADVLVILGDVYNHGPRNPFPQDYAPMKVAELLGSVSDKLLCIKGNCDSQVDQMISNFLFLEQEILLLGGRKILFTHGHVYNKHNLPPLSQGDVVVYGHFHICEIVQQQGILCVNVGSCALPKDGNHCYCLMDENSISLLDMQDNLIAQHTFNR